MDSDRITLTLNCLSESNDHQKSTAKKETVRVMGVMAEVLEDRLIDFLPRMIGLITKRLKDNDMQINVACSETMATIIGATMRGQTIDQAYKHLSTIFRTFFGMFAGKTKEAQIGAAMCIAKVIQTSPVECLYYMIDEIMFKLVELLRWPACKAQLQVLEAILSLLLAVEENTEKLRKNGVVLLPAVEENLNNPDWTVRKIAIEVIYTLSVLVPEVLSANKGNLMESLNTLRFDKVIISMKAKRL